MRKLTTSLLLCFVYAFARAEDLRVSSKEPIIVTAPDQWTVKVPRAGSSLFETCRIDPATNRNAVCLVSILSKDSTTSPDAEFLKKILRGDCRPYVNSPDDLPKVELKPLKLKDGLGFYANFVDPDLVGKPVQKGSYKTATPVVLSLGSKYLIKVTILCDELNGDDYRDALKIIESIRIKKD